MPRKNTPIRDLFLNTGKTRSEGSNAQVFACSRCGWELVDNATRFARHITRCPSATDADRAVAKEHLAGMDPEQIKAINDNAEFTRAFSLGGKAHVRMLFEDTNTTRSGEKAKLFRCRRCGHETTENATRFAQHILKCEKASNEDRHVAREHEALTEKRRQMRKAKHQQKAVPEDIVDGMRQMPLVTNQPELNIGSGVPVEPAGPFNLSGFEPELQFADSQMLSSSAAIGVGNIPVQPQGLAETTSGDFASVLGNLLGDAEEPGENGASAAEGQAAVASPIQCTTLESPFVSFGGNFLHQNASEVTINCHEGLPLAQEALPVPPVSLEALSDLISDDLPDLQLQPPQQKCDTEPMAQMATTVSHGMADVVIGLMEDLQWPQDGNEAGQVGNTSAYPHVAAGHTGLVMQQSRTSSEGSSMRGSSGANNVGNMLGGAPNPAFGKPASANDGSEAEGLELVQCVQQKRRRADDNMVSVVGFGNSMGEASAVEWQEFLAWKEARAMVAQTPAVPKAIKGNAMLFQQLRAHYIGHAMECSAIYSASTKAFGPSGSRMLVANRIRSKFENVMSVFKTLFCCCTHEFFMWMRERINKEPEKFLALSDQVQSYSKEVVALGPDQMIARRAPLIPTMDPIERAVYNCISKSFEELSLNDDAHEKEKNMESFIEMHDYAVQTGTEARGMIIKLLMLGKNSPESNVHRNSVDRSLSSDADSCSSDMDPNEEQVYHMWQKLIHEGMPMIEGLYQNDNAALASTAWLSELCEVIGWENALAFGM